MIIPHFYIAGLDLATLHLRSVQMSDKAGKKIEVGVSDYEFLRFLLDQEPASTWRANQP